jgi:hypothetical protein
LRQSLEVCGEAIDLETRLCDEPQLVLAVGGFGSTLTSSTRTLPASSPKALLTWGRRMSVVGQLSGQRVKPKKTSVI